MRRFSSIAFISAIALVGCGTNSPDSFETALKSDTSSISFLEKMHDYSPKSNLADTALWEAITTQENSLFVVSYESLSPESKGQIAHNVKIALKSYPDIGLQAETAKIWGMNPNTLSNLSRNTPTKIADRIDLTNVTYFGFKEWMEDFSNHTNKLTIDTISDMAGDDSDIEDLQTQLTTDLDIEKYDFSYGRITLDGLHWNGLIDATAPRESESENETQIWDVVAAYARWSQALNVDALLSTDIKGSFIMHQAMGTDEKVTQNIDMSINMPLVGMLGYDKGNTAFIAYKDVDMQMSQSMITNADTPPLNIDQGGTTGLLTIRDFDFANLFTHLANRELPPTSATNLLSLGKWHGEDMVSRMGEDIVSESKSFDADMSNFHWLIPTKMTFNSPDTNYNMSALINVFTDIMSSYEKDDMDASDIDEMNTFVEGIGRVLNENDLENIGFAGDFGYEWNPETGKFNINMDYDFIDLLGFDFEFDGFIGDFASYEAAHNSEEGFDGDKISEILQQHGGLNQAHYAISDYGVGLDKIFGLVIDIAKLIPEEEAGQMAMLQSTDAPNLRLMASSMIRMGGMAGKEHYPQAVTWANLAADFVQKGGEIEFSVKPEKTINKASIEAAKASGIESPEAIIDFLGVALTHTAPAE